jgi:hypothetical protein
MEATAKTKKKARAALPRNGSVNDELNSFEIGERRYIETTIADYPKLKKLYTPPKARAPTAVLDKRFSVRIFTAVGSFELGDIRYLLCVERLK